MKVYDAAALATIDADTAADVVPGIVEQIKPMLAGLHPAIQGAVIADLVAIWISGYQPESVRQEILDHMVSTAQQMVPIYDQLRNDGRSH